MLRCEIAAAMRARDLREARATLQRFLDLAPYHPAAGPGAAADRGLMKIKPYAGT